MQEKKKKSNRITIYDIAEQLNIAPSSVSKALNNSPSVSDAVKLLVKNKASELNYRHNSQAASLRNGKSNTIGVIVPKINSAFFSNAISGMEEVCTNHQHQLIICQTEESYIREKQAIGTLIANNVDCIIISQSMETTSSSHLKEIIKQQIPLIQFDRINSTIPCHHVVNDNKAAAYHATRHLINQGYKQIAFLGGSFGMEVYNDRKDGYLQALREHNIMVPYDYVLEHAYTQEKGQEIAKKLLTSAIPPDAFFTSSDHTAVGVIKATTELGLSIPDQVGIVGFANEPFAQMITPSLTTVDQNSRIMGIETANIYFTDLSKSSPSASKPIKKTIPCTIVFRSTTRNTA